MADQSALECPVCFETFDQTKRLPKILGACGHSLCQVPVSLSSRRKKSKKTDCGPAGRLVVLSLFRWAAGSAWNVRFVGSRRMCRPAALCPRISVSSISCSSSRAERPQIQLPRPRPGAELPPLPSSTPCRPCPIPRLNPPLPHHPTDPELRRDLPFQLDHRHHRLLPLLLTLRLLTTIHHRNQQTQPSRATSAPSERT